MNEASAPATVLVIANETLGGAELLDAVKTRATQGPIRVVVVAPVNEPGVGYVVYQDSRRAAASRRLDRVLAALHEAGVPAQGSVAEASPLDAAKDALAQEHVDELIVATHPAAKSGWLRRNLVDEIRKVAGSRPVQHVVVDSSAGTGSANVLVLANETVISTPLLDRIRARASEGPASFLVISPQSDPGLAPHPEAERRLGTALSTLRAEGIDAHGHIAHPDPYTAAMQALDDEPIDEVIVSTFTGERSGWLRRDLVGRLRSEAKVPVEHVVAEPATAETAGAGASRRRA